MARKPLAGGRLSAGGRGERDRGGVWGGWAVARGGGVSRCRDAAGGSISRLGCSAQALGAVGEGLVAPGQNSPLMRLQLGDLAFPVDGGVGAVVLAGQDEVPPTRSTHFSCQAPTRRQRGIKRWVWLAKRSSARGAHLGPSDRTAIGGSVLCRRALASPSKSTMPSPGSAILGGILRKAKVAASW